MPKVANFLKKFDKNFRKDYAFCEISLLRKRTVLGAFDSQVKKSGVDMNIIENFKDKINGVLKTFAGILYDGISFTKELKVLGRCPNPRTF